MLKNYHVYLSTFYVFSERVDQLNILTFIFNMLSTLGHKVTALATHSSSNGRVYLSEHKHLIYLLRNIWSIFLKKLD